MLPTFRHTFKRFELYALPSSKMKTVIFLAITIILQTSKNCEANGWYKRCDLNWTPKTPFGPLCSNPLLDGQIIALNSLSCVVIICINGIPSKAMARPCWPLITSWQRASGCLSKQRGCYMDGKRYYEMHVFNAAGIKLIFTPKRICVNRVTRWFQVVKPAPMGIEAWLG